MPIEREVPTPDYSYEIERLVSAYRRGLDDILRELDRFALSDMQRAQMLATLKSISGILSELDGESALWVAENIPKAATDGIAGVIFALGIADTLTEAYEIAKPIRLNKTMIDAAIADLQTDLLVVTQNVDRRVRMAVRQAMADAMRANMAAGITGVKSVKRDMAKELRDKLGKAADNAIIDSAGRRWKLETYVDMAVNTKMAITHVEATRNEAISRGVLYGRISRHGATDPCRDYEGKIVRLTEAGDTKFPTVDELRSKNLVFHPRCRHSVTATRLPNGIE